MRDDLTLRSRLDDIMAENERLKASTEALKMGFLWEISRRELERQRLVFENCKS